MSEVLIVADSRGRRLSEVIKPFFNDDNLRIIWRGGLKLTDSPAFAYQSIIDLKPKLVYFLAGICDLTQITSRDPWTAPLRYVTTDACVTNYMMCMDVAMQGIFGFSSEVGHPIMVIFPTQTGLNFTVYNGYPDDLISPSQRTLDSSILPINKNIVALNKGMHIKTPFLATAVHMWSRKKLRNLYYKLEDGCHPSYDLAIYWARKLKPNVSSNLDLYDQFALINSIYN